MLDGAAPALPRVSTLQLEMSPVRSYEGETLFVEMYERVVPRGVRLHAPGPEGEGEGR